MAVREIAADRLSRHRRRLFFPILTLLILTGLNGACQISPRESQTPSEKPEHLVRAELLANTDAIVPGREFLLGARFIIAPEWYIYYKDPGDAGLPTTVDLKLPEGFSAAPVMYPTPTRFNQPGDILGYGYKEEVMLIIRVSAPATLAVGNRVAFRAHAQWLACRNKCIVGENHLDLFLPVAQEARTSQENLFRNWMERVPQESISGLAGHGSDKSSIEGDTHASECQKYGDLGYPVSAFDRMQDSECRKCRKNGRASAEG